MHPTTHNGFVLEYDGPFFPAAPSNQITYNCFCLMGGLANGRLAKVLQHGRYTYYRIDRR